MALTMARCTNCGANLQVDMQKEAAVCEYCGSAFIVEKAVTNYYSPNISGSTINIYNAPTQAKAKFIPIVIQRKSSFIGCAITDNVVIDNHMIGTMTNGKKISLMLSPGIHYLSLGNDVQQVVINSDCTGVDISIKAKLGFPNGKLYIEKINYL